MPRKKAVSKKKIDLAPSQPIEPTTILDESKEISASAVTVRTYRVIAGVVTYAHNPTQQKQRGEIITSNEFQSLPSMTAEQLEQHYLNLKWIELV